MLDTLTTALNENRAAISAGVFGSFAVLGFLFSAHRFLSKIGSRLQGTYTIQKSWHGPDSYVSGVSIENLKDRPVSVRAIYLQLRAGAFLEVERFDDLPLLIKPYEVYQQNYDPVNLYGSNMIRLNVEEYLSSAKLRADTYLFAQTNFGKTIVHPLRRGWSPHDELYKNAYAMWIKPERVRVEGVCHGPNVDYLVRIHERSGRTKDFKISRERQFGDQFALFEVTDEAMASEQSMHHFFEMLREWGVLQVDKVEIADLKSKNQNKRAAFSEREYEVQDVSRLRYFTDGRLSRAWERLQRRRACKKSLRQSRTVR